VQILELRENDELEWDDYVENSQFSCPYHLVGWKRVMEKSFGHPSHYLMAKKGGQIAGVLPMLELKSKLLGHSFTTLPGGICAENEEAAIALIEHTKKLTTNGNARYFSIRDSRKEWDADLKSVCNHFAMVRDLPEQPDELWNSLDRRLRRHIRIAKKNGLQVFLGSDEYLDDFYSVYSTFLRDIGTPTFGKSFLRNVLDEFSNRILICCTQWKGTLIGAYMAFKFHDAILGSWGGSINKYMDMRPNHMIYWSYMQYGCESGCKRIDFGRTRKDSGHFIFKKGWGAKPQPLYQQFYLNGVSNAPVVSSGLETRNRYRIFVNIWRHLPVPVAEIVGPQLRHHVPFG
jgi:FemAB-related protein (PEP-CTERM system-associated)